MGKPDAGMDKHTPTIQYVYIQYNKANTTQLQIVSASSVVEGHNLIK